MTAIQLGTIKRLDPRDVWASEPQDFTPWLQENIELLGLALGLEIEVEQREKAVGSFAVDLYGAEVGSGRRLIIENQLEPTNHGHLGQLLTYAAGLDAGIVIWVTPEFRDEHRQAIEWLNQQTNEDVAFFGVQVELLQIDGSHPAPDFKVVALPSEFQRGLATTARAARSPLREAYHEFFVSFLALLKERDPGYTTASRVGYDNWLSFGAGRSGFSIGAEFFKGGFRANLYIDVGERMANKSAFDQLFAEKNQIEDELSVPLTWERLEHARACRIYTHREGSINSDSEALDQFRSWAVDRLIRLRTVFSPRLQALDLEPAEAASAEGTP